MRQDVVAIASAGGHMFELLKAISQLNIDPLFITYRAPHLTDILEGREVKYICHPRRNPFRLALNILQAFFLSLKLRPKIVISTGADVAVPFCIISKVLGSKLVFIESGAMLHSGSLSGKLLYPLADLFIVQWESLLDDFPNAVVGGPLL